VSTGRRDAPSHPGERAAEDARHALGLGLDAPISVLDAVEEIATVPVCVTELSGEVAGLFYRHRGQVYLFVNGADPVVRQRFTLAHEFGHHRMGHEPRVESLAAMYSRDQQEVEANYFAGAFLAPRQAIHNWAARHPEPPPGLELVVRVGAFFGLSPESARIRLELAGVVDQRQSQRLKEQIAAREHRGLRTQLGLSDKADALSQLRDDVEAGRRTLPRLPAVLVRGASMAHSQGLLGDEDLHTLLRGELPAERDEPEM
jgi:Zn-dependent peptidase ImmA (M78 family)